MTISTQSERSTNIGIDVGKEQLDVVWHETGEHLVIENTAKAIRMLIRTVQALLGHADVSTTQIYPCPEPGWPWREKPAGLTLPAVSRQGHTITPPVTRGSSGAGYSLSSAATFPICSTEPAA